ncbi:MAG: phosphoribosylglycinamide formyltransferase [Clostridia bacterium]
MVKIAVLVSGGGTNLQALIDAEKNDEIKGGKISLVLASREDAYALTRAKNADIETTVLLRKTFSSTEEYSKTLIKTLKDKEIDLIVLAGFMTIFSDEVTKAFENKIINIHPALIPSFCGKGFYGLHVHEGALARGVKLTGATVHFVNEICDGGPIIMQKAVEVLENDTAETLQKRVMEQAEWELLPKAVSLFCQGKLEVKDNLVYIK